MTNLKEQFGDRYKVRDDGTDDSDRKERPWCLEIPCRYGAIYPHSGDGRLAARADSARMSKRLEALGYPVVQRGDQELVCVFPPADLERVADVLQARRRRKLTAEQRAKQAIILSAARERLGGAISAVPDPV
ncbi:MAG: hypothetical protein SF051_05310 [Elusimicrobiota bacterium]|nr:hypothetical protein [Elusimicrobiota bacterium]